MVGQTGSRNASSEWPAAVVAVAFLAFIAALFLVVYHRDGVDAALKVWAAIGTAVGVITGRYQVTSSTEPPKRRRRMRLLSNSRQMRR